MSSHSILDWRGRRRAYETFSGAVGDDATIEPLVSLVPLNCLEPRNLGPHLDRRVHAGTRQRDRLDVWSNRTTSRKGVRQLIFHHFTTFTEMIMSSQRKALSNKCRY